MKAPIPIRIALLLPAAMLCACTSLSKQVYVASDTSLGVNGAMNTAQTAGKLVIGYDRKFVAYVPTTKLGARGKEPEIVDAMAVYNCTHLEVQGMRITAFREQLATGDAAKPNKPKSKDSEQRRTGCEPTTDTQDKADDKTASATTNGGQHEN